MPERLGAEPVPISALGVFVETIADATEYDAVDDVLHFTEPAGAAFLRLRSARIELGRRGIEAGQLSEIEPAAFTVVRDMKQHLNENVTVEDFND